MIAKVKTCKAVELTSKIFLGKLRMNGASIFDWLYFLAFGIYRIKPVEIPTLLAQNTNFFGRKYAKLIVYYSMVEIENYSVDRLKGFLP